MGDSTLFYHSLKLTRADIEDILRDISFKPQTTALVLNNNYLGDEGVRLLVEGLKQYRNINHLALSSNQLTDQACAYIGQLSQIERLDVSNNNITDAGGRDVMSNPLKYIDVNYTQVTPEMASKMKDAGLSVDYTNPTGALPNMSDATLQSYIDQYGVHTIFNRRKTVATECQQANEAGKTAVLPQ